MTLSQEMRTRPEVDPLAGLAPRTAVALLAIGTAVVVRVPLEPALEGHNTFLLLEPAIAIAAWYGGRVSGFTATLAGVLVSWALYLPRSEVPILPSSVDTLSLALFAMNGVLITVLSAGLRGAYQRERRARRRAEEWGARNDGLQRLALALNRPMSPQALTQTAIEQTVTLLGASGGIIATGRPGDRQLTIRAAHGYTGGVTSGHASNDPASPLGAAVHSSEPSVLHGRSERVERFPQLADRFESDGDSITIPLLYQRVATGALYLNFPGRTGFGSGDHEYLRSIGAQVGSALERSFLIERTGTLAVQEQARAAELNTILEAIGDAVLVGGPRGEVILANSAAQRLLGVVPARIRDLPAAAPDAPLPTPAHRYLARSPVRADRWLEVARFKVKRNALSSDVVLVRDATRTVEADLQREAFLGVLSHELRTPVTSILVAVDLMRRLDSSQWPKALGLLDDVDAEMNRLYVIIEDLMVLTRFERGALDIVTEPVLVHRVVSDVGDQVLRNFPDVAIEFSFDPGVPPAEAEPTYVQQVARNLISNAIKYGRNEAEPIQVLVSAGDGTVETRVLDRGVGIGADESGKLFNLFYRNPKASAIAPGAGIGLYVCRLLVEAMQGSLWARPRDGGGAEFGFSLPVVKEAVPVPRRRRGGESTNHSSEKARKRAHATHL